MQDFYGISKPSQAIRAMIRGLLKNSEREDFRVNMSTFGYSENGICYGCAATCALQELSGVELNLDCKEFFRDKGENVTFGLFLGEKEESFENAIDFARNGLYRLLFRFFGISDKVPENSPRLRMTNENWKREISKAEALASLWEENNF